MKVLEKWKKIHENADKYIFNVLSEIPYSSDIIDVISKKLKNNVQIRSVFSADVIVPEDRKKIFEEKGFQKFVSNGLLERKISKSSPLGLLITDKEAAVFFPNEEGQPDLSEMFFSTDENFHEWCQDYFDWCWKNSANFQESKLD